LKFDDSGKFLNWKEESPGVCHVCGRSRADHRLYETDALRNIAQDIRTRLSRKLRGLPQK
jgi:hypothetical protein